MTLTISEFQLKQALKLKQFRLYFQPKLNLVSRKICGVEALIRLEHPEDGLISPLEFIPLAEETGLIAPIGEWVLRKACEQAVEWVEAGLPPMIMAVNLSGIQLYRSDLVIKVKRILEETGFPPEYLELEITESMMVNVDHVLPVIKALKAIGIRIGLDDFGTGFSSLKQLKEFPIDVIKIDQSFIQNCKIDEKDATIVKAIIAMAHELKIEVIAEGIESKEHLIFLQQNLCHKGQGYLFSKPIDPKEFTENFHTIEQIMKENSIPEDINREKWLEQELETTRNELKDVLKKQQGTIFKFIRRDRKFIHTLCDGELMYKMGFTSEQIVGKELNEFFPIEEANQNFHYYSRAWNGEENVNFEGCINGIWYMATLRPIRSGGEVVAVIGSSVDITERKASEERYQKVVEYSPKGILIHQNGKILYANPSCIQILKEDNLVGQSIYSYILPNYHKTTKKRLALTKIGQKLPIIEYEIKLKDGEVITGEFGSVFIPFNGETATLVIFSDVTDRKRAEEALRKSEERFRLIAKNMQDLICVLDPKGNVRFASSSHESVMGIKSEFYIGKPIFHLFHQKDNVKKHFDKIVTEKRANRMEYRFKHEDGDWRYLESIGTPILNEQGETEQVVIVSRDISERKKTEEALRKSDRLSVAGQLAAGVAHEVRNPLTSIKGFIQLLRRKAEDPIYFDLILSEIARLEEIVSGFLSLAKPQEPQIKETQAKSILQHVLTLFQAQANMNSIEIVEEVFEDLPSIYVDANQIEQVLINILQNAIEAMPDGGRVIVHTILDKPNIITLRIIDQGQGMTKDRLKHIGEPFFSTKEKGTGLGMMISQRIVEEHGGSITIKSELNKGTTVDVNLPINRSLTGKL